MRVFTTLSHSHTLYIKSVLVDPKLHCVWQLVRGGSVRKMSPVTPDRGPDLYHTLIYCPGLCLRRGHGGRKVIICIAEPTFSQGYIDVLQAG